MIIHCNGGHAIFRQTIFLPWNWFKHVQGKNRQDPNNLREYKMEGYLFLFFFAAGFGVFLGFLVLCFPVSLVFCFSAFLLHCFSASLLFLLLCFSASLLFAFPLLCFSCFSAFLLLCFSCFSAFVLLCLSTSYSTFSFLQSCVFAALLPAPLLLCFLFLLSRCFSFSFALFWSVCILNETLQRP